MVKKRLVAGVGANDADYAVGKRVNGKLKLCPYYEVWKHMLTRCYNAKDIERYPKYAGCSVYEDWLVFSNFRLWMSSQNWEGRVLDKDILVCGNRVYSPETCAFIHHKVNGFVLDGAGKRGKYLIGACWEKRWNCFFAQCRDPFLDKQVYLGSYTDEYEAHTAWKKYKHKMACLLADSEYVEDSRIAEALRNRYKD